MLVMMLSTAATFVFAEAPEAVTEEPAVSTDAASEEATDSNENGSDAVVPEENGSETVDQDTNDSETVDSETVDPEAVDPEAETTEPVNEEAAQPEEEPQEVTLEAAASEAMSVTATRVNNSSTDVVVTWTPGATATSSTVTAVKDGSTYKSQPVSGAGTSYTFTGLPKGKYVFRVTSTTADKAYEGASSEVFVPAAITGFETYSAYKSVVLECNIPAAADMPDRYEIWVDGKCVDKYENGKKPASPFDNNKLYMHKVDHLNDADNFNGDASAIQHKYQIKAFYGSNSIESAVVSDTITLPFKIRLVFKQTKKLKSHKGIKASHKFRKGDVVYATSYVRGQYHFEYAGSTYYVNYNRVGGQQATLNGKKGWNYSAREAQYFINTAGETSKKGRMIYVNLYTQHIYLLTGAKNTKGQWKVVPVSYKGKTHQDWEISSGKPKTPSPWGLGLRYKKKPVNIYTRERKVNGHVTKYWNFYHSETAIHGRADNKGYGAPYSHGCIRNPDYRAIYILKKIPLKTRVVIY